MADKSFGVKELNLISASGTPTITSPNSVNINATNVAISTDITVGGMVSLGAGTSISSPGTNVLSFGTNSTEKVRIDSSGNVNIGVNGTSNPFTYLRFGASNFGAADIRPTNEASHKVGLAFYVDGTQDTTINPTEALRIASNGDIGIANASPTNWGAGVPTIEIKGTVSSGGNATRSGAIAFESGSGSNGYAVLWGQSGGIHIYTGATDRASATYAAQFNSSGNLAFASGNGIDFSATGDASGMSSELLDDYEEGTWSPDLRFNNAASGMTYSRQEGHYTKIGRQVFAQFRITLTSKGTSTGTLTIRGLPFTATNTFTSTGIDGQVHMGHDDGFNSGQVSSGPVSGYVEGGTDYFYMTVRDTNATLDTMTNVYVDNDLSIAGTAIYYA